MVARTRTRPNRSSIRDALNTEAAAQQQPPKEESLPVTDTTTTDIPTEASTPAPAAPTAATLPVDDGFGPTGDDGGFGLEEPEEFQEFAGLPWWKPADGENQVRLLKVLMATRHTTPFRAKARVSSHTCPNKFHGVADKCIACDAGVPLRREAFFILVDRKTGELGLYNVATTSTVYKEIYDYGHDAEYGDPRKYDLKIVKKGKGKKTDYDVRASKRTSEPTEAELAALAEIVDDVKKLATPPEPDSGFIEQLEDELEEWLAAYPLKGDKPATGDSPKSGDDF